MQHEKNFNTAVGLSKEVLEKAKEEVVQLFKSTKRCGVEKVVDWVLKSNFCTTSGSTNNHSSFRGGLLCHSLNVATVALQLWSEMLDEEKNPEKKARLQKELPRSSVVLSALLHDISKEPLYHYNGAVWEQDKEVAKQGHGSLSVKMIENLGLTMTTSEKIAIRWHDYDLSKEKAEWEVWKPTHKRESKDPLLELLHKADRIVRPLENGLQKQGIYCPLHYADTQLLKDTQLKVRQNLEGYPAEKVEAYPIGSSFAYNNSKEVNGPEAKMLPKGEVSVLSMRYPCSLPFEGKTFVSAEALVLYQLYTQSPEIQTQISQCTTNQEAVDLCTDTRKRDKDWRDKLFEARLRALEIKALYCREYREKLVETGDKPIVQLSNYPRFLTLGDGAVPGKALGGDSWQGVAGIQDLYLGCNSVGKAHMEIRKSIV